MKVLQNDNKALFYGTTIFKRNEHNLFKDFGQVLTYLNSKKIVKF